MKCKIVFVAIAIAALTSGCRTWDKLDSTEKGAVIGGGTGAIVGSSVGEGAGGTIIGGAAGALGGGLIGREVDRNNRDRRRY